MVRVLRVLCREDFSIQSAKMFAADLKMAIDWLDAHFIYTQEQACLDEGANGCRWPCCGWFRFISARDVHPRNAVIAMQSACV